MAEKRLDFNPIEARGIFMMVQGIQQLAQASAQAVQALAAAEAEAAEVLGGRLPPGVTVHHLRVDQQTNGVFCPAPDASPTAT